MRKVKCWFLIDELLYGMELVLAGADNFSFRGLRGMELSKLWYNVTNVGNSLNFISEVAIIALVGVD